MHFLFVLVDSRLEPQAIDLRFIRLLGEHGIPFGIVFTKTDKLSRNQLESSTCWYPHRKQNRRSCRRSSSLRAPNARGVRRFSPSSTNV